MQSLQQVLQKSQRLTFSQIPSATANSSSMMTNKADNITPAESKEVKIPKRIETLFGRFAAIYGYTWWSVYKNERLLELTKQEWTQSLARFNNGILKESLLHFRESKGYPPTLPQFIECCKNFQKRFVVSDEPDDEPERAAAEVAFHHLKAIFQLLKN